LTQGSSDLLNNEPVVEPIKLLKTSLLKVVSGTKLLGLLDEEIVFMLKSMPSTAPNDLKVSGLSSTDTVKEFFESIGLKPIWLGDPAKWLLHTFDELNSYGELFMFIHGDLDEFILIVFKYWRLKVGKER
jgi:hypothetical protein